MEDRKLHLASHLFLGGRQNLAIDNWPTFNALKAICNQLLFFTRYSVKSIFKEHNLHMP